MATLFFSNKLVGHKMSTDCYFCRENFNLPFDNIYLIVLLGRLEIIGNRSYQDTFYIYSLVVYFTITVCVKVFNHLFHFFLCHFNAGRLKRWYNYTSLGGITC